MCFRLLKKLLRKKPCIKLVITDIDGVWTDGGMYYDQSGNELKRFSTYDGGGVTICHQYNVPVAIITGENTKIVAYRAKKLNIDYLYQGVTDKVNVAKKLVTRLNITFDNVAFIGDDIGDLELLKKVRVAACPNNAIKDVKKIVVKRFAKNGGEGVFRDFCEWMRKKKFFY